MCPVAACTRQLATGKGGAKASLLLRAQIISVLRLALLQMNLWAHPKKKNNNKLCHTKHSQIQFQCNLLVPWCLSSRRGTPRAAGMTTLQCVATRQAKAKTINWSNRLNCMKGLNVTRDKQVEFCGVDKWKKRRQTEGLIPFTLPNFLYYNIFEFCRN